MKIPFKSFNCQRQKDEISEWNNVETKYSPFILIFVGLGTVNPFHISCLDAGRLCLLQRDYTEGFNASLKEALFKFLGFNCMCTKPIELS